MYRHRRRQPAKNDQQLDRWLVSYADYMTLMFALFVVLYSMSIVKEEHYKVLSETLGKVFDNTGEQGTGIKGEGLLDSNEVIDPEQELYGTSLVDERGPELVEGRNEVSNITDKKIGHPLEGLAKELDNALLDLVENGIAEVEQDEQWLTIALDSSVMFASGSANPTASAAVVLKEVVDIIGPVDNYVRIRGYTDNRPINTELYASNWELSVARATAALKLLQSMNIAPQRMAVEGYGEYSPFADNSTAQGRNENRKVVIALSKYAYRPKPLKTLAQPNDSAKVQIEALGDHQQIQVIKMPSGGIRITTRRDNPDALQQDKTDKDKKDEKRQ